MTTSVGNSSTPSSIQFLQVGQGDATLVVNATSQQALVIDCPAGKEHVVEQALVDAGSPAVIAVILTHWDRDHYGGVLNVVQSTGAGVFYYNHETVMSWEGDRDLRRAALRELLEPEFASVNLQSARRGDAGVLGDISWRLIAPYHRHLTTAVAANDRNLASGVLDIQIGGHRFILGGDADGRVWERLLADGESIACDVLRWPHHGALNPKGGINEDQLVAATDPKYVVVSVGSQNRYRHPKREAIWAAKGARLGCTEVTSQCHSAIGPGATACGGTLSFTVTNGILREANGWLGLDRRVDGWDHPLCRSANGPPDHATVTCTARPLPPPHE